MKCLMEIDMFEKVIDLTDICYNKAFLHSTNQRIARILASAHEKEAVLMRVIEIVSLDISEEDILKKLDEIDI